MRFYKGKKVKSKKDNVLSHFIYIGLGTVLSAVLGFFTTPYILRVIDPTEYGKLSIFNSYGGIILSFAYLGLERGIVRFFYTRKNLQDEKNLLWFCLLSSFSAAAIIFCFLYILELLQLFKFEFSDSIYTLLIIYTLISIWNTFSNNLLRLTYQTKAYSFSMILQKIVYVLVIIIGVSQGKNDLEIVVLSTILSIASASLIAVLFTRKYWVISSFGIPDDKNDIFKYSLPYVVYGFLFTLIDSMDKFFIRRFYSEYEVGVYTSAFSLIVLLTLVQSVFNTIWSPVQTEHFIKDPDDTTFIRKGNRYLTIIMFTVGFTVIFAKDILAFLLGQEYREAVSYMPFLVIDSIMMILVETINSGINKSKKSYLYFIIASVACAVDFFLLLLLVPRVGPGGASVARSFTNIAYYYLTLYFSEKYYRIDYGNKKMCIVLVMCIIYSFINSFMNVPVINAVLYLLSVLIIIVIYRNDIIDMFDYLKNYLISFIRK